MKLDLKEIFYPTKQKAITALLLAFLVPLALYAIFSMLKVNMAGQTSGIPILFSSPLLLLSSSTIASIGLFFIITLVDLAFWYLVASIGFYIIRINKKSDSK